jgi:hypothetical protein
MSSILKERFAILDGCAKRECEMSDMSYEKVQEIWHMPYDRDGAEVRELIDFLYAKALLAENNPTTTPATTPRMSESNIPGICAKHAIVTPECRANKGHVTAFEEAISRLFDEYALINCYPENVDVKYHLVLTVERPALHGGV